MASKIGGGAAYGGSPIPSVAGAENQANSDINVTPMIDVMLVLLIIFMVITPALAGYTAVLPKAVTAAPEKEDRVTLGIDNEGRYYLDEEGKPIPPQQLTQALVAAYQKRPPDDHVLYLKAHDAVEYSVVLTAIESARQAGVARIGAITEIPAEAQKKGK